MLLQLFFFIFLSLIFFTNTHGNNISLPSTCPEHHCGNGPTIRYPFWLLDRSTSNRYCGYPKFGITCPSNGEPMLSLRDDNYIVKNIDYINSRITLVDADVVNQTCPRARHNLKMDGLPLDYSNLSLNLTFYFNCSSRPSNLSPIGCLGSYRSLRSYVVWGDDGVDVSVLEHSCQQKVVATVMKKEINIGELISGFGAAMKEGFVLDWQRMKDCGVCEASGGFCGYNNIASEFLCFCHDGQIVKDNCRIA